MRRSTHIAWAVAVALAAPQTAAAQTAAQVEALQDLGNTLRFQRRNELALRAFELSNDLAQEPRTVARVALAEMAIQRWLDAETHLSEALQSPQDPWIQEHRAQIDAALREVRTHLGLLRVHCDVEGARVWLGTTNLGRANGAVLRAPSGSLEIEVRAEGYRTRRLSVSVPQGAAVTSTSATLESFSAGPPAGAVSSVARSASASPGTSRTAGPWVLVGVGAAAVVGYFVLDFGLRAAALDRFEEACPNGVCAPSRFDQGRAAADEATTYGTLARVSLGVGVAAATAGIVWAAVRPASSARPSVEPEVSVGSSVTSLSVRGRF